MTGSVLLSSDNNDSPEFGWVTPTCDARMDVLNNNVRVFASYGGETSTPLLLSLADRTATVFGNLLWNAGNFDPTRKADKATTLAGYGITDALPANRLIYSPNAPKPTEGAVGTLWLQYEEP